MILELVACGSCVTLPANFMLWIQIIRFVNIKVFNSINMN